MVENLEVKVVWEVLLVGYHAGDFDEGGLESRGSHCLGGLVAI